MADTPQSVEGKKTPPSLSFTTFLNFLNQFTLDTTPTHIDRSVMGNISGGTQIYIMHALKFFGFVSKDNVPEPVFHEYVESNDAHRPKIWRRLLDDKYSFLLSAVDIERTTTANVADKFRDQGISGDTIRKAITFFLHAAKQANMKVSPHVKAPRPVQWRSAKANPKREMRAESANGGRSETVLPRQISTQTPYEMLIDILNARMTPEEQEAVWILIRYLKKAEMAGE